MFGEVKLNVEQAPDIVTRDAFPERKQHPNLVDQFVSLSALAHVSRSSTSTLSSSIGVRSNSHVRSARLLSEVSLVGVNDCRGLSHVGK